MHSITYVEREDGALVGGILLQALIVKVGKKSAFAEVLARHGRWGEGEMSE